MLALSARAPERGSRRRALRVTAASREPRPSSPACDYYIKRKIMIDLRTRASLFLIFFYDNLMIIS